jgi:hypothetical protein
MSSEIALRSRGGVTLRPAAGAAVRRRGGADDL